MNKKILVAINDKLLLNQIKLTLEDSNFVVITCCNGKEAINLFNKENPNLVILELKLPQISGEIICQKIRLSSNTPIIMLGDLLEEEIIIDCFKIGIDDYLVKPTNPKIILAHINAVLRRIPKIDITYQSYNYDDLIINYTKYQVFKKGVSVNLTPIEFKILSFLSANPSQVFTRKQIIQEIAKYQNRGSYRSIDSHIKNIRKKIEDNPPVYVKTVHGIGYKFMG